MPQDGYKFKEWEGGLSRIFDNDATIKALYEELADIIPGDEPKPSEDYVTVIFHEGTGKSLTGEDTFHVKKGKVVDLTPVAPTAVPQDGY